MPARACVGCPFRSKCPIVNTTDGRYVLIYTDEKRRLAERRREQETDVFKERYAMRSGIESTNSGLKNRLGMGKLRVRGRGSVFRVVWHKLAAWNLLRGAASKKLRAWVAQQVASTIEMGAFGSFGHFLRLFGAARSSEARFSTRWVASARFKRAQVIRVQKKRVTTGQFCRNWLCFASTTFDFTALSP